MTAELFVEGKRLDISADISSLLTFAIDDIKNFASRQTTFSKTIVLPGTANNNAIFGNIFSLGISNSYDITLPNIGFNFNASKSAKAILFQDYMQTFKGSLRLLEIDADNGVIEYQVALNGDLTTLNVSLTNGLLTDLDFSAYNIAYTAANIVASWDNSTGAGLYFPLIDYGNYSPLKHDWDFKTFRPALFVKEYIDKMFAAAGFRYESALFNTDRFKRAIVPHNQKNLLAPKTGTVFTASAAAQSVIDRNHGLSINDATFASFIGGLFSTTDHKTFTYNGATPFSGTLLVNLSGLYNFGPSPTSVAITLQKNGADYYNDGFPLVNTGTGIQPYFKHWSMPIDLSSGDTINVHYVLTGGSGLLQYTVNLQAGSLSMSTTSTVMAPIEYGETVQVQYSIPQNIRQIDFLVGIINLWNLYVYEDPYDDRLIHISPFVDFFDQGTGSVIDWTYKMDRSLPISIKPMSEINSKIYNFNYKSDSDYYNDLYQKRYNQGYGSFIFDSDFEFATETNTMELIFAPTPIIGYVGEDKVYSTIFKRTGDVNGVGEENVDSVIRILLSGKVVDISNWNILNGATVVGTQNYYGYAGHFDDPYNPGNDLNFGGLKEVFFKLDSGQVDFTQFNVYWSAYMSEITDKDSKLLTAQFYLKPIDILNLSFAKFITIDGVLFRLNKITDYNATMPGTCAVELLNVLSLNFSYPPGSESREDYVLEWAPGFSLDYQVPGVGPGFVPIPNPITYR